MSKIAALGGEATARVWESEGFTLDELPPLESLEDAKLALDAIRRGVLCRKCTHNEATAATRAVGEWVKTVSAVDTKQLVTDLRSELEAKTKEIAALRKDMTSRRPMRAVK